MRVLLKDTCLIIMGQSPDSKSYNKQGNGLPFYQGNADFGDVNPITRVWSASPIKIAEEGDILISVRAPIGAMNIATTRCCIGRGLAALRPIDETFDNQFLFYALQSRVDQLIEQGTGSTFKAIGKSILEHTELPCYPLESQIRIVDELNNLGKAIDIKNVQLTLLDEIVKSRFIEMFGDYSFNPKGWRLCRIGDITTDVRYGTSLPASEDGEYPYLRMNNITYEGELDLSEVKRINVPLKDLDKCSVRKGDVLFNRTNSWDKVGKTCVYDQDGMMVLAGFIIRVRVANCILPEFLSAFLNTSSSKEMFKQICKRAIGQANINAEELKSIGIFLPPINLQGEYVAFKQQVDKSKLVIKKNLAELEELKNSLMQKYFFD